MNERNIALLIDCDNASANAIESVLEDLAKHGAINIRHAHGNWRSPRLNSWYKQLQEFSLKPMQQFPYTTGKNATDIAMVIDAMDILSHNQYHAFAIMSSDSDYTPLVMRLKESGIIVYGYGETKTPSAFVQACSQFINTDELTKQISDNIEYGSIASEIRSAQEERTSDNERRRLCCDTKLLRIIRTAIIQTADDQGWAHLGQVGKYISNNNSFSPINYGYPSLAKLIRAMALFELSYRGESALYVRDKRRKV